MSKNLKLILISLLLISVSYCQEEEEDNETKEKTEVPFNPLIGSFLANFLSEFGDKTFLVSAIMAMKYNRWAVFFGGSGGLTAMTLIGCVFGYYATAIISPKYTHFISGLLFLAFGLKMLYDAYKNVKEDDEEDLDKEMELIDQKIQKDNQNPDQESQQQALNPGNRSRGGIGAFWTIFSTAFVQVFLAEFGDKSQISTIALAARYNATLVFIGSSLGLAVVTGIGVISGKVLADKVSPRALAIAGGILFLLFALHALFIVDDE